MRAHEDTRIPVPFGPVVVFLVAIRVVDADTEVARPPAGTKRFHAARSCSRPARLRTFSRRFSNSSVAGMLGRRCSFVGNSPRRRIMYFIGIGFVSKN